MAAASGVASFAGLSIDKAGTNKVLTATATLNSTVRTATTSPQFAITPGAVNSIALTQSASGSLASAADRTLTATLLDAYGNTVTDATGDVTFAKASGTGTLVGLPATVASANGVATVVVSGAQVGTVGVQASYTPVGGGAKTDTTSITVVEGAVAQVELVPAATGDLASGGTRAFTATLKDAFGNTVTGSSASVTFSKVTASGAGTVTGLSSVNASSGVATLTLTGANPGALQVQASVSSGAIASIPVAFNVIAGAPATIALTEATTGDLAAGASRMLTATLLDGQGNVVTGSTATVTFAKSGGGAGTVDGLGTAIAINGVAEVTVMGSAAGSLNVVASITSPSAVSSSALAVTVVPGAISKVVLTASASGDLAAGATRTLTATIQDAKGNTITSATGASYAVTFAKAGGTGTLTGLGTVNPTSGVATVTVTGDQVGSVTLIAATTVSATTYTSADVTFAVVPGAPSSIELVASGLTAGTPDTLTAGSAATLAATIKDAKGNTVTSSTASVTFGYASNTGTVTGLGASTAVAGVATKSITAALAGAVEVQATVSSPSLTSSSVSFTVVPGAAASMTISTQPGGAVVGSSSSPQPVIQVSDAQGNPIATAGLTVTATVATGAGLNTGTVTNDTATTNSSGVATFSGLTVNGDGGNYKLQFAATGLTAVTSSQFTITKTSQTITFANPKPTGATYGDPPFPVAPTSSSGLDVVVTSLTTSTCQVSGTNGRTVSITGAGNCQLQATQAGNGQVDAATPVTQSFTIAKAAQAAVRIDSANTMSYGATITLVASGGSGTGALTFGTPTGPCTLSGTTLTATGAGTCTVSASRAADDNYLVSSNATQAITIGKAGQVLAFTSTPPESPVSGGTYTPTASSTSTVTSSSTGLTPAFTIAPASSAICSINGSGVVSFAATGTCTIEANQAGNANVNPATQVTQVIEVGSLNQSITFAQPANATYGGSSVLMSATASSGLAVSFAAGAGTTGFGTAAAACVVSTLGAVTINDIGTCEVVASQAGDSQYAAASSVKRAFSIVAAVPGSPHITSVSAGDQQVTVAFTAPGYTGGAAISAYEVTAIPNAGGTTVTTSACSASASPLACTITGLVNGTSYTIKVAAINAAGTGPESTAGQSMTPGAAAFAVTGLSAASALDSVTLTWTPLTAVQLNGGTFTHYEVSYRLASGGAYTACPMDDTTGLPVTPCSGSGELKTQGTGSITIGSLAPGTSYEFKVVAITSLNDTEIAGNSETVTQFPITVPTVPRTLTVLNVAATTVQFSWIPPADDGGTPLVSPYYEVTVESTDGGAVTPITCTVTGTYCNATGMTNGAVYVFSVYAMNAVGNSQVVTTSYSVPSDDATLSNLVLGSGTALNPSFASNVTAYTATVPFSSSTVTVTPTAAQSDSTITVAGMTVASGSASGAIALAVGSNAIAIVVTAPDPTHRTTYTITVTRDVAPPPPPPAPAPDPGPSGGGGGGGGGGATSSGPDLGLIVPAVTSTLALGSLQVLQGGEPVSNVRVAPNRQDTGIDVTGRDFTMQVITAAPDRRPVGLASGSGGPSLVAEAGGWVDVRATGYAPETTMRAFLARRGAPRSLVGASSRMVANVDSVFLGEAIVPSNGDISTAFPIPDGINLGDYVLQVNGVSADRQVRSVNLTLTVIKPTSAQVVVRRGCVFASGSANLTRGCERYLRVVSQRIPRNVKGVRITIVGVSVDEPTRKDNRALARKRARTVALYLRALGVRGTYVRATVISTGKPKGPLAAQAVVVRKGKPRTTVTFRFTR